MSAPNLTIDDIEAAAARITGQTVYTPLLRNDQLDAVTGARVFLKCENLQRTGSFKFRGAYNALSMLDPQERQKGVVAISSGNHAQGVAEAARLYGVPATIVMPHDAPAIKAARVKRSGATIVGYERTTEDRNAIGEALAEELGRPLIRPFDDLRVMAGQGTAGLESSAQLKAFGAEPDIGLICCGGGGLCAGVSTAWRAAYPDMDIFAVEPEHFDDTARSFRSGQRERNAPGHTSVCDSIITEMPGALTFPINVANGVQAAVVRDIDALRAVAFAYEELKLVVEPGGAVALAVLLFGGLDLAGKTVVATLSGGNIDPAMLQRALET